jgi:hypothetical protein
MPVNCYNHGVCIERGNQCMHLLGCFHSAGRAGIEEQSLGTPSLYIDRHELNLSARNKLDPCRARKTKDQRGDLDASDMNINKFRHEK